jgi:hypothetical protein
MKKLFPLMMRKLLARAAALVSLLLIFSATARATDVVVTGLQVTNSQVTGATRRRMRWQT